MRSLLAIAIAIALPQTSGAEIYECFFVQSCRDNGEGCFLTDRHWTFDTENSVFSTVTKNGTVQFIATSTNEVFGLLTIFPETDDEPGRPSKFSVHSKTGGPKTILAESYHGACLFKE